MKWLRSGLRRDVCVVVASEGSPTAQECKAALEARYDDRIDPGTFYGALGTLVEKGHLIETQDGIHDRYELTEAGERTLRDHYDWVETALD
ncbi:PadR family transcriptional regulator [Haloplanus halophilus]|uniref:PadR family transcriptional regulator n=1 Tax=Haloplanus halophilus TaxID=2949993 RepID=UPI00203B9BFF|nr:PadR family transcriptional regulator [Haloplanus sp. GDY1]